MLFEWNDKTIDYYSRAAEYTGYFRELAKLVSPALEPSDTLLDVGCGTGLIDMELAPSVRSVTAADRNEKALSYLREESARRGIGNIRAKLCEADECVGEDYDMLLMCFFGNPDESMKRLIGGARRGAVIMTHADNTDRSRSTLGAEIKRVFASEVREFLGREGFTFEEQAEALDFSQPFISEDDAKAFFEMYSLNPNAEERIAAAERRMAELIPADPPYALCLPKERRTSIFIVKSGGR
ncbi:MAG: methyltransferase domain-containing protein [Clostridiales Family XIII bacterium]|jgi:precorrin-6B methylase 2|nr:methyltransferase domain-containing protein [Clostridiales Family XIII bacterium]